MKRRKTKFKKEVKPQDDEVTASDRNEETKSLPFKKPDTKPLDTKSYVKFVKCVYNSPVNVKNAPSGTQYSFQPGQTLPVRNPQDYHHLMSLKRNPGPNCCGGAKPQPRTYFDVVEMEA